MDRMEPLISGLSLSDTFTNPRNLLMDITFITLYVACQSIICTLKLRNIWSYPDKDPTTISQLALAQICALKVSLEWVEPSNLFIAVLFPTALQGFHIHDAKFSTLEKSFNFFLKILISCVFYWQINKKLKELQFRVLKYFFSHVLNSKFGKGLEITKWSEVSICRSFVRK